MSTKSLKNPRVYSVIHEVDGELFFEDMADVYQMVKVTGDRASFLKSVTSMRATK